MVLCGSLELQSRSMVAGSVRMVYAIIYSLFLGYGITIGTALYGLMDSNAISETTCSNQLGDYYKWLFVPCFTLCLCIINQAKWKQMPVMLLISFSGYVVNFFSAKKFPSSAQLSNTFGALAVGVLGNLYSRMRHGVAAAALLPAIFVQVPSGLAASGSLLAGLSTADQLTNTTTYANGTAKITNGTSTVGFIHDSLGHHFLKVLTGGKKTYVSMPLAVCLSAYGYSPLSNHMDKLYPNFAFICRTKWRSILVIGLLADDHTTGDTGRLFHCRCSRQHCTQRWLFDDSGRHRHHCRFVPQCINCLPTREKAKRVVQLLRNSKLHVIMLGLQFGSVQEQVLL